MLAYVLEGFDAKPTFVEWPTPPLGPDDALIRVSSSSVNPHDAHVISGAARAYLEYRFPLVLGCDVCGVVEHVGANVTRFAPGDRVFGLIREPIAQRGAFAEYVSLPADRFVVAAPSGLHDIDAGALPLSSMAALGCLDAVGIDEGDSVLVNGATGGVGSCVVQIAAALGAHVIATARPGAEAGHVRALGASEVVDWSGGEVAAVTRGLHPAGVDCVIDLVNFEASRFGELVGAVLRAGGRSASTLMAADAPEGLSAVNVIADASIDRLERMAELAAAGILTGHVTETFRLGEVEDAFAALAAGALGKIALRIAG